MINLEFKFVPENPVARNQYILTVDYMHGDADGYTTEEYIYPIDATAELKQDLLGLITFINLDSEFDDAASDITPIFEAQGIEDAFAVAEEWSEKFYKGDITCDQSAGAGISGYSLVFYNDHGDKHDVELRINGKLVE